MEQFNASNEIIIAAIETKMPHELPCINSCGIDIIVGLYYDLMNCWRYIVLPSEMVMI